MIDRGFIKNLASSGAWSALETVVDDLKEKSKEITFNPNPQQLSYNCGRRDGYMEALNDIITEINNISRE